MMAIMKRRNYLFLLIFLSSAEAVAADSFGRLFLTPQQRAQLETTRAQRDRRLPIQESEGTTAAPALPPSPEVVTYNGVVRRSDGKSTVWLNGKPVNERNRAQPDNEVSVTGLRNDGAVSVAIPQAERRASLKVGQSLSVTSGTIEESYLRRETLARPASSTPPAPATPDAAASPQAAKSPATNATAQRLPPGVTRPPRESDTKEADAESGAAPAVRPQGDLQNK
jgi:hypothetical protein